MSLANERDFSIEWQLTVLPSIITKYIDTSVQYSGSERGNGFHLFYLNSLIETVFKHILEYAIVSITLFQAEALMNQVYSSILIFFDNCLGYK